MKFYTCFPHAHFFKMRQKANQYGPPNPGLISAFKPIAMRVNIIALFIGLAIVNVSANVRGQNITLKLNNVPVKSALEQISKQTGYFFWYEDSVFDQATNISLTIADASLKETLDLCFKGQPLQYKINGKTIVVTQKEKGIITAIKEYIKSLTVRGTVSDGGGNPIPGVTVRVKGSTASAVTDNDGRFTIEVPDDKAILIFSYVGFEVKELSVGSDLTPIVTLKESVSQLQDISVVNTGYQQLPKERATGSFVQIDNSLFNRRVGTNVLDRLDGVTSGLIFNKASSPIGAQPTNEKLGISIRGRVTIDNKVSADPLVVLDNFPFEGDLNTINPNDIESITVLKDAAAASIWGARSGNGVIVITTKSAKLNQALKIDFNANVTIGEKPDLHYSRNYLPASDYIDIETYLFNKNYYDADLTNTLAYPVISPVVEILAGQRAGTITAANANAAINSLRNNDVRDQSEKYLYQKTVNQQYALSLRGGSEKVIYNFSLGYDRNRGSAVKNENNRLTINSTSIYRPLKDLELTIGIFYSKNNGIGGYNYTSPYPYALIADESGNALTVPFRLRNSYLESAQSLGFIDWKYRPLDEARLNDYTTNLNNILLRGAAKYHVTNFLSAEVQYQYQHEITNSRYYKSQEKFEVRNLINTYSQRAANGTFTYPFPLGGILDLTNNSINSNNFRTQISYDQQFDQKHKVTAIAGAEIREIVGETYYRTFNGYNDDLGTSISAINYNVSYPVNPAGLGSRIISAPYGSVQGTTYRYISYYANAAYSFMDRYLFSISGRKDGANIFGVKTNDKITPLWSAGLGYEISREPFYKFSLIPYLKVRATYGYNGNVYNGSAYLTASYFNSGLTGQPVATVTSPPNSELRWEKIRNKNLGIDFSSKQNRVSGTVEIYDKLGTDLIEDAILAPSTGFSAYKGNAASVQTRGVDLTVNSININGRFKWATTLLYNYNKDKVISYDTKYTTSYLVSNADNVSEPSNGGLYIVQGNSLFGVYSYRFAGLEPSTGDPQGFLNGKLSKDYAAILSNDSYGDIVYHGSSRPRHFGSLRNTFSYMGFSLSANVTYKLNYFTRKRSTSTNYAELFAYPSSDYAASWQKPGDELITSVPSLVYATNTNRNTFYQNSDALVIQADHIRLQDINLSYDFSKKILRKLPFSSLQIYSYINNIGILWRANKDGIDPDVSDYRNLGYNIYPNPRTFSFGIKANFK